MALQARAEACYADLGDSISALLLISSRITYLRSRLVSRLLFARNMACRVFGLVREKCSSIAFFFGRSTRRVRFQSGQVFALFVVGSCEYAVVWLGTNWEHEVEKGIRRNNPELHNEVSEVCP